MTISGWNNKILLGINIAKNAVKVLQYEDSIDVATIGNEFTLSDYYPNNTDGNQADFSTFDRMRFFGENYQKVQPYEEFLVKDNYTGFWLKIGNITRNTFLVIDYLWSPVDGAMWEWNENKQIYLPTRNENHILMQNLYGLDPDYMACCQGSNYNIYPYNNSELPYLADSESGATNRGSLIIDLYNYCHSAAIMFNNFYIYINAEQWPDAYSDPTVARLFVQQISVFQCVEMPFSREITSTYTYSQNSIENTSMSGIVNQYLIGWPEVGYNLALKYDDLTIHEKIEQMRRDSALNGGIWWLKDKDKYFYIQSKQAPQVTQLANLTWELQLTGNQKY